MSASAALCPNCRKEVVFVEQNGMKGCPNCGFLFRMENRLGDYDGVGILLRILRAIGFTVAVLASVLALILGIAFIGCLLRF